MRNPTCEAIVFIAFATVGCGSSGAGPQNTGSTNAPDAATVSQPSAGPTHDAGPPPIDAGAPEASGLDHGAPSSVYPAFVPDAPQVLDQGGGILTNPEIVTVTWAGDPLLETFEKMADAIGATQYWTDTVSEYGVGAAKGGAANHVRVTSPLAASVLASDLEKMVTTNVTGASPAWPAYGPQKIYTLLVPSSTKVFEQQGDSDDMCAQGAGGYHSTVTSADGKEVVYAIILQCPGASTAADATESAAHEWIEAATDPYSTAAWQGLAGKFLAYDIAVEMQDEVSDMCEFEDDTQLSASADLPFVAQRSWSNKSARAGHAPCVPASPGAYANVALLEPPSDKVSFDVSPLTGEAQAHPVASVGYGVAVGAKKTIALGFFSDAASDAWTIDAAEWVNSANGFGPASGDGTLTLSLDKTSGKNGEKSYLEISRTKQATTGSSVVVVTSNLGGVRRLMPFLVGNDASAADAGASHRHQERAQGGKRLHLRPRPRSR